jgi:hypothetical protein
MLSASSLVLRYDILDLKSALPGLVVETGNALSRSGISFRGIRELVLSMLRDFCSNCRAHRDLFKLRGTGATWSHRSSCIHQMPISTTIGTQHIIVTLSPDAIGDGSNTNKETKDEEKF